MEDQNHKMFMNIVSGLALVATVQASTLGEASRRLQGAADVCSPSDAELLTLIEIVLAQNEKLTQQTNVIGCLTTCQTALDADCDCAAGVVPPPAPPPPAPEPDTTPPAPEPDPTPEPDATSSSGLTVQVSEDYAAALGDDAAFADCFLTPEEIESDPEAAAFAAAFLATAAAQLGVDASTLAINGISTDGDDVPGCDGSTGGGGDASSSGMVLQVTPEFAATLGSDTAFLDCWLTPEEIATDPEAAAFAEAFKASTAATLGVDPSSITLNGLSTSGQAQPGCGPTTQNAASSASLDVSDDFAATLADSDQFSDCVLSPEEIAADAEAAALAQAFREAQAAALGIPVEDVSITGIEATAGQGCSSVPHAASEVSIGVSDEFVLALGDASAFGDCWLSAEEIASDPDAAAFAAAFLQTQADALGVSVDDIQVSGISTDDDASPGCSSGRRLQSTPQLKVAMKLADSVVMPKHVVASLTIAK